MRLCVGQYPVRTAFCADDPGSGSVCGQYGWQSGYGECLYAGWFCVRNTVARMRYGKGISAGVFIFAAIAAASVSAGAGDAGTGARTCLFPVSSFPWWKMHRSQLWCAAWTVSGSVSGTDPGIFLYPVFHPAYPAAQQADVRDVYRSQPGGGSGDPAEVSRGGSVSDVIRCTA